MAAYTLTYRVTSPSAPVLIEDRVIKRPFFGRYLGHHTDGTITTGAITNSTGAYGWLTGPPAGWALIEGGTRRATADQHVGATLRAALHYHLAEIRGERRLLGRPCTVVRTGGPIGRPLTAPTQSDHADLCVDRTGIALEEVWLRGGRLVRRRQATAFNPSAVIDDESFQANPYIGGISQGQAPTVRELTATDVAGLVLHLDPPPGLHEAGGSVTTVSSPFGPITTVQLHFANASNLLDLSQTAHPPGAPPPAGLRVPLGQLGTGYLTLDLTASYLDIPVGNNVIRLEGADPTLLAYLARHKLHQ